MRCNIDRKAGIVFVTCSECSGAPKSIFFSFVLSIRVLDYKRTLNDTQSDFSQRFGSRIREEIHVMARRCTSSEHFSASEQGTVIDEFRTHQLPFNGPNAFGEPVRRCEIRAHAAEKIHGSMGMAVHKAWHNHVIGELKDFFGFNVLEICRRDQRGNSSVFNRQAIVLQNFSVALKRNDPAGKKEFFGLHILLLLEIRGFSVETAEWRPTLPSLVPFALPNHRPPAARAKRFLLGRSISKAAAQCPV